jgi:hypothetical protein
VGATRTGMSPLLRRPCLRSVPGCYAPVTRTLLDTETMHIERSLRASDDDREQAAERLRLATAEGRLSVDELGQRLDGVYAARTVVELDGLLTDLPVSRALSRPRVRLPGLVGAVGAVGAATLLLAVLGVRIANGERHAAVLSVLRHLRRVHLPGPFLASHHGPAMAASLAVALVAALTCAVLLGSLTRSRSRHQRL